MKNTEENQLNYFKRPQTANEALELLEYGEEIEVRTDKLFDLLRYFEKAKNNLKCNCRVNHFNVGWVVLRKC